MRQQWRSRAFVSVGSGIPEEAKDFRLRHFHFNHFKLPHNEKLFINTCFVISVFLL